MDTKLALRDSHLHLFDLVHYEPDALQNLSLAGTRVISSCHRRDEFMAHSAWMAARPECLGQIACSFGIHPQKPVWDEADFLVNLAKSGQSSLPRLAAIGECGYDFYQGRREDGPLSERQQDAIFLFQVELAIASGLPLVVHLRRAVDLMFRHTKLLRRVSAIIFHSWPAPPEEGKSLIVRGINAFFSLGTSLLQGNKRAIRSLMELPPDRILMETDAPYQTLKGQTFTGTATLDLVYQRAAEILSQENATFAQLIQHNFDNLFDQAFTI